MNLSQTAYDRIKTNLYKGKYEYYVNGRQTAAELGMGFSPVKEALQKLEQEGILKKIPNNGYFVNRISDYEIAKLYQVQECFELYALREIFDEIDKNFIQSLGKIHEEETNAFMANDKNRCNELDFEFHACILKRFNNSDFLTVYTQVKERQLICGSDGLNKRCEDTIREHGEIIEALQKGDRDEAVLRLKKHLRNYKRYSEI